MFLMNIPSNSQEVLDGVVAIVGEDMILRSDLVMASQQAALRMRMNPITQPEEYKNLMKDVLENLITQKVLLAKAKEDTITVDDQRVEAAMEERIQFMVNELGSIENVEKQLNAPIAKIKRDNWDEMKKSLIVQTLQNTKLNQIQVSRREVEAYYESEKDKIPDRKASIKIRHILFEVRPGQSVRDEAVGKLEEIRKRLGEGAEFEEMARQYSEDPGTASNGGNLGWVEKGTFPEAFEDAAFRLNPGEISEIIESPVGIHLVQMIEKKENEVNIRHILLRLEAKKSDDEYTRNNLEAIRNRALAGESFAELAKEYSHDQTTKDSGGDLGWWVLDEIEVAEFRNAIDTLEVNEISLPFRTQFGYHIVLVEAKEEARKVSLEKDWDLIQENALMKKKEKVFLEWIEELKKGVRIEIKEDLL
jgi:peptidyl-prolyl cis-trans isomerase SurA